MMKGSQLNLKLKIKVVFWKLLMFDVTIKSDTGQHLQILRCFQVFVGVWGSSETPFIWGVGNLLKEIRLNYLVAATDLLQLCRVHILTSICSKISYFIFHNLCNIHIWMQIRHNYLAATDAEFLFSNMDLSNIWIDQIQLDSFWTPSFFGKLNRIILFPGIL